jgi:hypothetical protein
MLSRAEAVQSAVYKRIKLYVAHVLGPFRDYLDYPQSQFVGFERNQRLFIWHQVSNVHGSSPLQL